MFAFVRLDLIFSAGLDLVAAGLDNLLIATWNLRAFGDLMRERVA